MKKRFLVIPLFTLIGLTYLIRTIQEDASANMPRSKEPVQTIKVGLWDYEFHEYDKKLIEAFCEENPNIKVEIVTSPNVYYASKVSAMLAGGEDIDVIYTPTPRVYNNLQLNHFIIPLDDLIRRDQVDISRFKEALEIENQIYGLPYRSDWYVLYYNKNLFDKKNLPYPTNDMTWEEYRQLGKQLTSGIGANKTYGILTNTSLYSHVLPPIENGREFDYINGDLEALRRGLELFLGIQFEDQSALDYATNKAINSDQRTFEKGQTGMFINGTWFINYLINDKKNGVYDFEWGVVKVPHWGQEQPISKLLARVSINIKTAKLEAAWEFVKFVTGSKGAKILAGEAMLPAFEHGAIHQLYIESSGLENKDLEAINGNHFVVAAPDNDSDSLYIKDIVYEEIEKVITQEKSIDEGIADMKEKRRQYLKGKY
jgi:multiple sugar transport system substrate-binding protein